MSLVLGRNSGQQPRSTSTFQQQHLEILGCHDTALIICSKRFDFRVNWRIVQKVCHTSVIVGSLSTTLSTTSSIIVLKSSNREQKYASTKAYPDGTGKAVIGSTKGCRCMWLSLESQSTDAKSRTHHVRSRES